jgi:hypothetical protein
VVNCLLQTGTLVTLVTLAYVKPYSYLHVATFHISSTSHLFDRPILHFLRTLFNCVDYISSMIVIYELYIGLLRRKRKYSWTVLMDHAQRFHGGTEENTNTSIILSSLRPNFEPRNSGTPEY